MKNLEERIREAADQVQPRWTPERARRVEEKLSERTTRAVRPSRLVWALSLSALAAVLVFDLFAHRLADPRSGLVTPGDTAVHFQDGSVATLLSPSESAVWVTEARSDALTVAMRGRARFEVTKNPRRLFRVEAGPVAVEVIGTRFRVEMEAERTRVTVEEGRVRIISAQSTEELRAGESALFPRARPTSPEAAPAPPPAARTEPEAKAPSAAPTVKQKRAHAAASPPVAHGAPDWRLLAEQGDYEAAYEAYRRATSLPEDPRGLLLAADVARFSHHAEDAIRPLERLLEAFSSDPVAPLAAFTLGRVLLEDLGHPREAAQAFREAVELAPRGPLAEDAIARGVEAWSRAGDDAQARRLAEEYVRRFPEGRRIRAVRRFGRLE